MEQDLVLDEGMWAFCNVLQVGAHSSNEDEELNLAHNVMLAVLLFNTFDKASTLYTAAKSVLDALDDTERETESRLKQPSTDVSASSARVKGLADIFRVFVSCPSHTYSRSLGSCNHPK
eukprot:2385498-Ditylum_brightwellii.AAC.1